jgi:nucleotide-binding universal stress UspA family protein
MAVFLRHKAHAALRRQPTRVAYRRILVPLVDDPSEQAVGVACRLADDRRASVTAVAVIEVPAELALDSHMFEEEEAARRLLAEARAIADRYGVSVSGRSVRGRDAGEAIVHEAERAGIEIIVLTAPRRKISGARGQIFGGTADFVLKHATCRVMVCTSPDDL